ncbi:MAG: PilZ domain-containing protein [Aquificota bacterium]|nr:PilZ domain-containing protein [Aquificota bacterium]
MKDDRNAEVFIFEDTFFFTTRVFIKRVEGDRVALTVTPLLRKFAVLGKRIYLKYRSFALPVKVVGKSGDEIMVTLPELNPEKPVGDRRSARVRPSHIHPVRLYIEVNGEKREFPVEDISEGGFSITAESSYLDKFIGREVGVHIEFPVEVEEVKGTARLVNVQELENGKVKMGFEMFIEDADTVKVRFYVYSRIKEILRE